MKLISKNYELEEEWDRDAVAPERRKCRVQLEPVPKIEPVDFQLDAVEKAGPKPRKNLALAQKGVL